MHNELKITDMQTLESNKKTIEESTNPISLDSVSYTHQTLPTNREE